MRQLTFGSLFAGIGGIDLGLERAGMKCIWQVEIDDYCQKVLAKHWPNVPRYGDVHDVGKHNLETPDLICGGFPCQPVSFAGKGKAQSDPRWLWPQFARVVNELRPRYIFVENVPGLLLKGMGDVVVDLAEGGYDAEWDCLPASVFNARHKRNRVWLVAYTNDTRRKSRWQIARVGMRQANQRIFDTNAWSGIDKWAVEPDVGRVANGVPSRVDRLRGLGNAVVPQVAEWIGNRIIEFDRRNYE